MNQTGVKQSRVYAVTVAWVLMFIGAFSVTALALASSEAASGGWLAGFIIKIVNLFIKLVLLVA